jgi:hypothetical protein
MSFSFIVTTSIAKGGREVNFGGGLASWAQGEVLSVLDIILSSLRKRGSVVMLSCSEASSTVLKEDRYNSPNSQPTIFSPKTGRILHFVQARRDARKKMDPRFPPSLKLRRTGREDDKEKISPLQHKFQFGGRSGYCYNI